MDLLNDYIGNASYVWIPIIAFFAIIVIAGFVGWINGWKSSLYFLGWNLVGIISGIFISLIAVDWVNKIKIVKVISSSSKDLVCLIILFAYMLFVNFVSFIVYWFFRKKLKKSMKTNKTKGKSNLKSRFVGLSIAAVSSIPLATFIADSSAIMSNRNKFTDFLDKLVKGFTGGKFEGTSEARIIVKNLDQIEDFVSWITGKSDGSGEGDWDSLAPFDRDRIISGVKAILQTDFSKNLDDIYHSAIASGIVKGNNGDDSISDNDIKNVTGDKIKDNMPNLGIDLDKEHLDNLEQSLNSLLDKAGNDDKTNVVREIIAHITAAK